MRSSRARRARRRQAWSPSPRNPKCSAGHARPKPRPGGAFFACVMTPPAHGPCNAPCMDPIGRKRRAIAEGYIPDWSNGPAPQLESHETCCILNAGDAEATVRITVFFADREPAGPYTVTVAPRRTDHLRFNALEDPEPIPKDTPFASVIESDVPIVVQHTRLDSRQAENALMTTIAFAAD